MVPLQILVPEWLIGVRGIPDSPKSGDTCYFAIELLPDFVARSTDPELRKSWEPLGDAFRFCGQVALVTSTAYVVDIGLPVILSAFGFQLIDAAVVEEGQWLVGDANLAVSALPVSMLGTPDACTLERSWKVISVTSTIKHGVRIVVVPP